MATYPYTVSGNPATNAAGASATIRAEFAAIAAAFALLPVLTPNTIIGVNNSGSAFVNLTAINSVPIGNTTPSTGVFTTLAAASIDSTPIGQTTPAAGKFTTLSATGINSTPIGATTPSTGVFTTLAAASIDSTPIGQTTPAAGKFTTLSATGINSTPIGATTPSTGAFTTLSSSGLATFTGGITGGTATLSVAAPAAGNTLTVNGPTLLTTPTAWGGGQTAYAYLGDTNNGMASINGGATKFFGFNSAELWTGAAGGSQRIAVNSPGNVTINAASSGDTLAVSANSTGYAAVFNVGAGITGGVLVQGNVNDAGMAFNNQATGGKKYSWLSSGGASGLPQGSFTLYDNTASQARLQVSTAGAVSYNADAAGTLYEIGFRGAPINSQGGAYTLANSDKGKVVYAGGNVTVSNASNFAAGDVVYIINSGLTSISIIQGTGVTLYLAGQASNTGNRTLAARGVAILYNTLAASAAPLIWGVGLT